MYLIDSHVVIWDYFDDPRRQFRHTKLLQSDARQFVSVASLWEIEIKIAAKRLKLPPDFSDLVIEDSYEILDISLAHALASARLPRHHGDPFDRLLIAQAQAEGLTILTADRKFAAYDVAVI